MLITDVTNHKGINIYGAESFEKLKEACDVLKIIRKQLISAAVEGTTTNDLNELAEQLITNYSCTPLFKGFENYPYTICASNNEEIVHGFPNKTPLKSGDVLSIDLGIRHKNGYCSDSARTIIVGNSCNTDHILLIEVAKQAFLKGAAVAYPGNTTGDIGYEIQKEIIKYLNIPKNWKSGTKFKIFVKFCGHGIGLSLHEKPSVPNFGNKGKGIRLLPGMCICIEPVILFTSSEVVRYEDRAVARFKTSDGQPSAHYEDQVYVSQIGPINLTAG